MGLLLISEDRMVILYMGPCWHWLDFKSKLIEVLRAHGFTNRNNSFEFFRAGRGEAKEVWTPLECRRMLYLFRGIREPKVAFPGTAEELFSFLSSYFHFMSGLEYCVAKSQRAIFDL